MNEKGTPPTHTLSDHCPEALALLFLPYPLLAAGCGCCCYSLKIATVEHPDIHLPQESHQSLPWSARSCRSTFRALDPVIVNITKPKSIQQLPVVQGGGQLFLPPPFWLGLRPVQSKLQHKEAKEFNHNIKKIYKLVMACSPSC